MSAYDELSDEMVELLRKEVLKSERAYNYNFDDICIGAKIVMDKLKAENESLRAALKDAEYRADQGKVWNGMGWTYTGISAHGQQKVLDILRAAISSPENL